jgi:hypothetical protein
MTAENPQKLYSITELARVFKLDRGTVGEKLNAAGIKPQAGNAKEKLFALEDVEAVLSTDELDEVKLRKLTAEAELAELKLLKERGEFVSKAEIIAVLQKIFSSLHKKICVEQPNKLAAKLHKAKTNPETAKILRTDSEKIFNALRTDFHDFL